MPSERSALSRAPGAATSPGCHGQEGKITRHKLHAKQHNAGKTEWEQNGTQKGQFALNANGEGQNHGQTENGT